jgi:hypothetical protein
MTNNQRRIVAKFGTREQFAARLWRAYWQDYVDEFYVKYQLLLFDAEWYKKE